MAHLVHQADVRFEFAAPHYHDFLGDGSELDPGADVWFEDDRAETPPRTVPRRRSVGDKPRTPGSAQAAQVAVLSAKKVVASTLTAETVAWAKKRKHADLEDENVSNGSKTVENTSSSSQPRPLTVPKSPRLMTRLRAKTRPQAPVLSRDQRELQEYMSIPKFKAAPLDRRIFESSGDMGVPRIQKHGLTEPQPFSFATGSRLAQRNNNSDKTQVDKAPLKKTMHQDLFVAAPLPSTSIPSHAKITEPRPFDLLTEERGMYYKTYEQVKKQEEERQLRKQAVSFHARPADVLYKRPFQPAPSTKVLTTIDPNVKLRSDFRSKERAKFDAAQKRREMDEAVIKKKLEEQREEQERKEIEAMRARLVHKAKPVPSFLLEGPLYRPSTKPLTVPESPMFSHKRQKTMRS